MTQTCERPHTARTVSAGFRVRPASSRIFVRLGSLRFAVLPNMGCFIPSSLPSSTADLQRPLEGHTATALRALLRTVVGADSLWTKLVSRAAALRLSVDHHRLEYACFGPKALAFPHLGDIPAWKRVLGCVGVRKGTPVLAMQFRDKGQLFRPQPETGLYQRRERSGILLFHNSPPLPDLALPLQHLTPNLCAYLAHRYVPGYLAQQPGLGDISFTKRSLPVPKPRDLPSRNQQPRSYRARNIGLGRNSCS